MNDQFMQFLTQKLSPDEVEQLKAGIGQMFMGAQKREKTQKIERYRHLNTMVRPHETVFVGSSLMEQFPINELLLDENLPYIIYNRGIGGYTTQELLQTLDACVYDLQPDFVYINIGTNDMNAPDYAEQELIERYRNILDKIRTHLPQAKLRIMAYYPVNPIIGEKDMYMKEALKVRTNARILSANAAVEKLAAEVGALFINANAGITDDNGMLKAEYTIEGMHMYGDGYRPVLQALKPYLEADWQSRKTL